FFRYLPPETRIRLLERRQAFLAERLDTIDGSLRTPREGVDDYTLAVMEHGRTATESDIAWLDGLVRKERSKVAQRDTERGSTRSRRTAVLSRKEHTS
ncbi:MAG: hypothetical protein OEW66_09370, partial [Actinomycetota bacterium]|nr:hypothetical protein [Actinomycetota bacterium]